MCYPVFRVACCGEGETRGCRPPLVGHFFFEDVLPPFSPRPVVSQLLFFFFWFFCLGFLPFLVLLAARFP